jgi:hypothetical protein
MTNKSLISGLPGEDLSVKVNARTIWDRRSLPVLPRSLFRQSAASFARMMGRPKPATRFVIFGQGRSGSSLLVDLLNSHPSIVCEGEHFHLDRNVFLGARSMLAYADGRSRKFVTASYGFKFKIYQLPQHGVNDERDFVCKLHAAGWKLIYLWRRNVFRQVLSNFVLERRGTAHLREGQSLDGNLFPFSVDVQMFVHLLNGRAQLLGREREVLADLPFFEVVYERDLADAEKRNESMQKIASFLGVPSAPLSTALRRISRENPREMIANYDELRQAVIDAGHGALVEDIH